MLILPHLFQPKGDKIYRNIICRLRSDSEVVFIFFYFSFVLGGGIVVNTSISLGLNKINFINQIVKLLIMYKLIY